MSHNKKESKNKEDVKEEVPKDDSIKDSAVTSQPMPSTAAGDKETSSERIEAGDKETTLEATVGILSVSMTMSPDDPANWTNEWHEPRWQDCGGEVDKLNVRLLGCCFCEANMSNSASLGVMEIDESGDRKYPYCGLFWLVGVLGIWLPWRPETYVLRRATRRRYINANDIIYQLTDYEDLSLAGIK